MEEKGFTQVFLVHITSTLVYRFPLASELQCLIKCAFEESLVSLPEMYNNNNILQSSRDWWQLLNVVTWAVCLRNSRNETTAESLFTWVNLTWINNVNLAPTQRYLTQGFFITSLHKKFHRSKHLILSWKMLFSQTKTINRDTKWMTDISVGIMSCPNSGLSDYIARWIAKSFAIWWTNGLSE